MTCSLLGNFPFKPALRDYGVDDGAAWFGRPLPDLLPLGLKRRALEMFGLGLPWRLGLAVVLGVCPRLREMLLPPATLWRSHSSWV